MRSAKIQGASTSKPGAPKIDHEENVIKWFSPGQPEWRSCRAMGDMANRSNRREWATALGAVALLVLLFWVAGKLLAPALRQSDQPSTIDTRFGATVERLDPATARQLGGGAQADQLVVTSVAEGGPADRAGVRPGDLIESVAGKPAHSAADLASAVGGAPVNLIVNRHGDHVILTLPGGSPSGGPGQGRS